MLHSVLCVFLVFCALHTAMHSVWWVRYLASSLCIRRQDSGIVGQDSETTTENLSEVDCSEWHWSVVENHIPIKFGNG